MTVMGFDWVRLVQLTFQGLLQYSRFRGAREAGPEASEPYQPCPDKEAQDC
jgi:hypothetical protein